MPFHQKVNNDARLTKMIEDLGITLNPGKPKVSNEEQNQEKQTTSKEKNE
ncbi:hypothetical protein [Sporolactobacillus laevolacticus]|uniref:Uncharacterized protein n=1 Tax=Sporolactobacillus laevolacticus DSM 442 TaxID=1395513 RepID=V6IU88_9BACL|nr:hypothetical protein [Sporolactobacillus laevolacticus]EST10470.1 hypothetical protein P343_17065 [Sporolactobacillus laevolacticus DSM 442]